MILTWASGVGPAGLSFAESLGEPVELLTEPREFEQVLGNVAPLPERALGRER